jgi:hypothetical protein
VAEVSQPRQVVSDTVQLSNDHLVELVGVRWRGIAQAPIIQPLHNCSTVINSGA